MSLVSHRPRTLGVAASLLAHAAFLVLLVGVASRPPVAISLRETDVRLVPDWASPRPFQVRSPDARSPEAKNSPRKTTESKPLRAPAEGASPPPATDLTPPLPPSVESEPGAAPTAPTFRATIGCAHPGLMALSPSERQACRDRFATATRGVHEEAELGIDPIERAAYDASWTADHSPQHMAGMACVATFGWHGLKWAHPSEGVKLGPLPCYVFTPKATFSVDPPPARGW